MSLLKTCQMKFSLVYSKVVFVLKKDTIDHNCNVEVQEIMQ